MQLARHHITHLLNALYTEGITSVSVRHPCEEIGELLEIDLSDPVATTVRFAGRAHVPGFPRGTPYDDDEQATTTTCPTRIPTSERSLLAASSTSKIADVETFFRRQGSRP